MPKFMLLSDLHIRETIPAGRTDKFEEEMWRKLRFIFRKAERLEVDCILQAGDFFDKPNPSYNLLNKFVELYFIYNIPIYCVYGQHDIYMRNTDLRRTALGLLSLMNIVSVIDDCVPFPGNVYVYGNSFGNNYQFKSNPGFSNFNILVTHDMIGNKPLYAGHEYTEADVFLLKNLEFNIILCGDYHYPFHIKIGDRHIINTGALLRMTRDERDMNRKLFFYLVDTDLNKIEKYKIPCKPSDEVFINKIEFPDIKLDNEGDLIRFIQQLKMRGKSGIHYLDVLDDYCREHEVSEEVKNLIKEVLI